MFSKLKVMASAPHRDTQNKINSTRMNEFCSLRKIARATNVWDGVQRTTR